MMLKRILFSVFCLLLSSTILISQDCSNRPEFDGFTGVETEAILEYICGEVVDEHVNNMGIAHGPQFLQWHREYIEGLEDHLLSVGMGHLVPLPAWDPCTIVPLTAPNVPGTLTTCPEQGAMPEGLEGRYYDCGDFATDKYSCENLCNFESFADFQTTLQADHDPVHNVFGETTFNTAASPGVVLFWPWHAFVDDIYLKYQVATADPDLPIELEMIEQNCCDVVFRAPKFCCSTIEWTLNGDENAPDGTWSDSEFHYMSATTDTWPDFTVAIAYTGTCGAVRVVEETFENPGSIPNLPSSPPYHMQWICMDDFGTENCYDFGAYTCLETMEVTTSSNKLIAQVDGTELCLYYIHPAPYTGTVTVTPVSSCGRGTPVTWTIYANSPRFCGDFGRNTSTSTTNAEPEVAVYPNPFADQLNVNIAGFAAEGVYTLELVDMLGRVVHQSQETDQATLNTSHLTPGLYMLRIVDAQDQVLHVEKYVKR